MERGGEKCGILRGEFITYYLLQWTEIKATNLKMGQF